MKLLLLPLLLLAPSWAQAYCVANELRDRTVVVEQEEHPDKLRDERRFVHRLEPGQRQCCRFHDLDCNPGGRKESIVNLSIRVEGEPAYHCGFPAGAEPNVKVTGGGSVRVLRNPRRSAIPYVVRVRTHDKDITGPRGLACPENPPKGK